MTARAAEIETAPLRHLVETGSTNEDALAAARGGEAGPLWIRADRQTKGRGRQGRAWSSPVGNLYCSLLLPVTAEAAILPQLSQVAAVALADAITRCAGNIADLRIKWPNDLLIVDAKLAGILLEATSSPAGSSMCVIGCGVNCASFPDSLPYRATSLADAGHAVSPDRLFEAFHAAMAEAVTVWDNGHGYQAIRTRWLARALPIDTPLVVRGPQVPLTGRFQGIDDKGRLLLLGPQGPVAIDAGDVALN